MATPRSGSGPVARPLPDLQNKEATSNGFAVAGSDSDSGGRRHASSSVSRVQSTPHQDWAAMQQVQQRMTFSDHSAGSSAKSTPRRKVPRPPDPTASEGRLASHSDPPLRPPPPLSTGSFGSGRKAPLRTQEASFSAPPPQQKDAPPSFAVAGDRDSSEPASEGEIKRSVSVSTILSKLDSVKQYLHEAESLHRQLKARASEEPGLAAQVEKLEVLVKELREQESSYLGLLLTLMERGEGTGVGEDEEEEFSEDGDDDDEDSEGGEGGEGVEEESVSLKASLQDQAELEALRQQKEMLQSLLEQQKQIRELEERQGQLLKLKQEAQSKLAAAEAKTLELQMLAAAAEEKERQKEEGEWEHGVSPSSVPQQQAREREEEEEEGEGGVERVVMEKLREVQARKERMDQMMAVLTSLTENRERGGGGADNKQSNVPVTNATQPQPAKDLQGGAELVGEAGGAEMAELQSKLAEATEARKRLRELKEMVAELQKLELRAEEQAAEEEEAISRSVPKASGSYDGGDLDTTVKEEEEEAEAQRGPSELERSLVADYQQRLATKRDEVRRLQQQRDELMQTQLRLKAIQSGSGRKRETTRPLVTLPPQITELSSSDDDENKGRGGSEETSRIRKQDRQQHRTAKEEEEEEGGGGAAREDSSNDLSPQLAAELRKQKQLYEELMRKTAHLQQLQAALEEASRGSEHDTYSLTSSTRLLDVDMTAATWGGSTEEDEGGSGSLLPSELDTTQEDATLSAQAAAGLSETVNQEGSAPPPGEIEEELQFSVTRHTSRARTHRRLLTPTDDSPTASGKRMKLDDSMNGGAGRQGATGGNGKTASAAAMKQPLQSSHFSAVWPGVIFPTSGKARQSDSSPPDAAHTTASSSHPQNEASLSPQNRAAVTEASQAPASDLPPAPASDYSPVLQHQLAMTTNMCSELLRGQNCLISAVCHRLDGLEMSSSVQQHLACLQQYHYELDSYYRDLYQSYAQIGESEAGQAAESDSEDPVVSKDGGVGTEANAVSGSGASIPPPPPPATAAAAAGAAGGGGGGGPVPSSQEQQLQDGVHYFPGPYGSPPKAPGYPQGPGYDLFQQQSGRSADPSANFGTFQQSDSIPPPPLPPAFSSYASPFQYPGSWFQPSPYHRSPFPGSHDLSGPAPSSSYRPLSASGGYRPFWPYSGTGMTPYGQFHSNTGAENQSSLPPRPGHFARFGLSSPSAVTAASLQVQPPSSPPSAPASVSNYQQQDQQQTGGSNAATTAASMANASTQCLPNFAISSGSSLAVPPVSHIPTITSTTPIVIPHTLTSPRPHPHPVTAGASLAAKGREMAVAELKEGIAASGAAALLGDPAHHGLREDGEEESLSSLPLSIPEEKGLQPSSHEISAQPPVEFSVFDALRDTIYSEVATLIASNENRPHFLVELFRELQLLSTDYLRQRALYFLQELVTQHLTEEALATAAATADGGGGGGDINMLEGWGGSENTPSESGVTSEDDLKLHGPAAAVATIGTGGGGGGGGAGFDYAEAVNSATSFSTPPTGSGTEEPFISDNLGDTVIRLDKAMSRIRGVAVGGALKPPVVSPGPVIGDQVSESSQSDSLHPGVDSQMLDEEIKAIMTDVIPLLKESMSQQCSEEVVQRITECVLGLVMQQEEGGEVFRRQLEGAITTTLDKYLGKRLHECGEDLLVDISEVLYNELAVHRLMQELRSSQFEMSSELDDEPGEGVRGEGVRGVEPALLQALGTAVSKTLQDEAESLGKSRDDDLAKAWDDKDQQSSLSADDEQWVNVELSVSESKPLASTGSGDEGDGREENHAASEQPSQAALSSDDQARREPGDTVDQTTATQEPGLEKEEAAAVSAATLQGEAANKDDEVPPSSDPSMTAAITADEGEGETGSKGGGGGGGGGGVRDKEGEGGDENSDGKDGGKLSDQLKLTTITQEVLEAQRKAEGHDSTGLGAILSTMEQNQELAGLGDELPAAALAEP